MIDIIFLSYDEPNAERNWRELKGRFPYAQRVHGVKGIANAHIAASKRANTKCFYVVDADAEILDTFDFSFKPEEYDEKYVHIWHAFNPATGLAYGYGGVKLFSKDMFKKVKTALDFSTSMGDGLKIMDEIACITRFNSDPLRAFRGAFREVAKLYITSVLGADDKMKREARHRLAAWIDPAEHCDFRDYIIAGAISGLTLAQKRKDAEKLLFINDHDLVIAQLREKYPEIDLNTDPTPTDDNAMKAELFFTTRIAGALYDEYVVKNLPLTELRDALSSGQMLSKNWLIEELKQLIADGKIDTSKDLRVAILGGWIGTLSLMLFANEMPFSVCSVDLDERANQIAYKLNYGHAFSAMTMDMYDVNYDNFDVVINTASEHISDIPKWRNKIPTGKIVIIQNNDFEAGAGHVSTVKNSTQLKKLLKPMKVLYEGTRVFPEYSRFMLIGQT